MKTDAVVFSGAACLLLLSFAAVERRDCRRDRRRGIAAANAFAVVPPSPGVAAAAGRRTAARRRRSGCCGGSASAVAAAATSSLLFAKKKPPPTSSFDLDAIEAFEERLLLEERQQLDHLNDNDVIEEDLGDQHDVEANVVELVVPPELDNKRVDAVLSALLEVPLSSRHQQLSRSLCGNFVSDGLVSLVRDGGDDDEPAAIDRKSTRLWQGQRIRVRLSKSALAGSNSVSEIIPQDIPLNILYEDESMIVIDKAANTVVHPAAGNWEGTVVNALAYHLSRRTTHGSGDFIDPETGKVVTDALNAKDGSDSEEDLDSVYVAGTDGEASTSSFRPGIVHRLDKGTTGVLVVAKTTTALAALSQAFADRNVKKTYLAITVGNPGKRVTIDKPIGRHPVHRQRMRVVPEHGNNSSNKGQLKKDRIRRQQAEMNKSSPASATQTGRRALSYVDTLAFDGKLSLVRVRIATGRTHQIRVHLQDRHTPIYGDDVYGLTDWNKRLSKTHRIERPLLHAHKLEIDHPVTGERMIFQAPMPDDMLQIVRVIYPDGEEEVPDMFGSSED